MRKGWPGRRVEEGERGEGRSKEDIRWGDRDDGRSSEKMCVREIRMEGGRTGIGVRRGLESQGESMGGGGGGDKRVNG